MRFLYLALVCCFLLPQTGRACSNLYKDLAPNATQRKERARRAVQKVEDFEGDAGQEQRAFQKIVGIRETMEQLDWEEDPMKIDCPFRLALSLVKHRMRWENAQRNGVTIGIYHEGEIEHITLPESIAARFSEKDNKLEFDPSTRDLMDPDQLFVHELSHADFHHRVDKTKLAAQVMAVHGKALEEVFRAHRQHERSHGEAPGKIKEHKNVESMILEFFDEKRCIDDGTDFYRKKVNRNPEIRRKGQDRIAAMTPAEYKDYIAKRLAKFYDIPQLATMILWGWDRPLPVVR